MNHWHKDNKHTKTLVPLKNLTHCHSVHHQPHKGDCGIKLRCQCQEDSNLKLTFSDLHVPQFNQWLKHPDSTHGFGLRRNVDEICTFLRYYAVYSHNSVLMFWDIFRRKDGTDRLSQNVGMELPLHTA